MALPHQTLQRVLASLPEERRRLLALAALPALAADLAWAQRPGFPPITHEQILRTFRDNRHDTWAREWDEAVSEEAFALEPRRHSGARSRPSQATFERARRQSAETVSEYLGHPRNIEASQCFGFRPIEIQAWATAERLREILTPRPSPTTRPLPERITISPGLRRLIRAEIANEAQGGTSPATLESAFDSVEQGYDTGHGDDMVVIQDEIQGLVQAHGDVPLRTVLLAAEEPAAADAPAAAPQTTPSAMILGDIGVANWPRDERAVVMGTLSVANLAGGPAATEENLPFFTLAAVRDALALALQRGSLNPRGQELASAIIARLPEDVVMCNCAHTLALHGPGDPACIGTGADMDPVYGVPRDERCACAGFDPASP